MDNQIDNIENLKIYTRLELLLNIDYKLYNDLV